MHAFLGYASHDALFANMDYHTLADHELIRRYCGTQPDQLAFNELWRRYEPAVRKFARHLTNACPNSYSRDLFFEEVYSDVQEKVVRKIHGYEGRVTFSGWLWKVTERAAIDRRRSISGRPPTQREFVDLSESELAQADAVFKDKAKHDPVKRAMLSEASGILNDIMERHVSSAEGHRSMAAIIFHVRDECPVREVAERLCTYERDIFRLFEDDYPRLKAALAGRRISSVGDVLNY
jgi:RNA polymerase sigma factor (sigma-70 family)